MAKKKTKSRNDQKILFASWETRNRGLVCLAEDWLDDIKTPPLALDAGRRIRSLFKAPPLRWGQLSGYYVQDGLVNFLLWPDLFPAFDKDEHDKVYLVGDFNGWSDAIDDEQWLMNPEKLNGKPCMLLRIPMDNCIANDKPCAFKFVTESGTWLQPPDKAPNSVYLGRYNNFELHPKRTGQNLFYFQPKEADALKGSQKLCWIEKKKVVQRCSIGFSEIIDTLSSRKPLGAIIEDGQTKFRIFAPRASHVRVAIQKTLEAQQPHWIDLHYTADSIWEATCDKDLHGWFYYYSIDGPNEDNFAHFDPNFKILDPYAKAAVSNEGPGIILDKAQLKRPRRTFTPPEWHNLVIMEAHVRDLIANADGLTEDERLGFAGLAKYLRDPNCYLRNIGINAVELQPIQEFDNQSREEYHWGYMTCNYFSPDSTYASDPAKATQVAEFQDVVQAFHEADMAVILDVVYNHVGEPNHLLHIDKSYYFEMDGEGKLSNWSGCGNDLRCEAPMVRKLIVDSLIHLVDLYDVDGFRFDLAELIGVETLKEIESELKRVKPSIILIAEPWSFRGHIQHSLRHTGFASWNDGYRDFIADYVHGNGNRDGIQYFLSGSPDHMATWPAQTVNYTESHDDRCWLDRITENGENKGDPPSINDRRRTHLMCSLMMASIGIPMIAEGVDMLRSKHGVNNTYQRGDLNALDYNRLTYFPMTHEYFRAWIEFRQSDCGRFIRLQTRGGAEYLRFFGVEGASSVAMLYNADYSNGEGRLLYAVNPHFWEVSFDTDELCPEQFRQVADHERFWAGGLDFACFKWQTGKLTLPPMSCGLWIEE